MYCIVKAPTLGAGKNHQGFVCFGLVLAWNICDICHHSILYTIYNHRLELSHYFGGWGTRSKANVESTGELGVNV